MAEEFGHATRAAVSKDRKNAIGQCGRSGMPLPMLTMVAKAHQNFAGNDFVLWGRQASLFHKRRHL